MYERETETRYPGRPFQSPKDLTLVPLEVVRSLRNIGQLQSAIPGRITLQPTLPYLVQSNRLQRIPVLNVNSVAASLKTVRSVVAIALRLRPNGGLRCNMDESRHGGVQRLAVGLKCAAHVPGRYLKMPLC